ncbi:hypothetical protein [Candidatus Methanomassiliicoccus intestinalis]|uniref:hypothetical protein n=1 Tax=Candidatus Methanomassiliicoccus intestinalis TaxID=1406512 RepID=UPI0037DCAA00
MVWITWQFSCVLDGSRETVYCIFANVPGKSHFASRKRTERKETEVELSWYTGVLCDFVKAAAYFAKVKREYYSPAMQLLFIAHF